MSATARTEPARLTRAAIIGHSARIRETYGASPHGFRTLQRYERAVGCRDSMIETIVARCAERRLRPFDSIQPITVRIFSDSERARRERWAREDRQVLAS